MNVDAISSLAFVVAAAAILVRRRQRTLALLVAAVGIGSFIQHGPHPSWQAYAHDLPLAAVLAYVAVDAASDLTRRKLSPAWWLVPTAFVVPAVAIGHDTSTMVQVALAVVAIGLSVQRARKRPALRGTLVAAIVVLGVGAAIGRLVPQGHAIWHVLAAVALYLLAAAVGRRLSRSARSAGR
ncbi:hypothetical protein [Tenggerimyces flavus]|uniref:Uncharacterized protein n=1 Tax=Tenggerimyces flavus TaxID=1708749 RepID=A0ABV7YB06_9ACTN|nr:hypothetical protein [Tenggerimyces flavus]MBM7786144.1 hypothetical protein [Tenggerimyces flavus]